MQVPSSALWEMKIRNGIRRSHHFHENGKFEYEFVETTGVRVIVGKGGMKENTERACKDFGAIHCVFPAGNAVVAAVEVEEIVEAQWKDLGMPETLWHCHVKEFGPLIVSIDSYGKNYFEEKKVEYNKKRTNRSRSSASRLALSNK